jgi:hypothetical protein
LAFIVKVQRNFLQTYADNRWFARRNGHVVTRS